MPDVRAVWNLASSMTSLMGMGGGAKLGAPDGLLGTDGGEASAEGPSPAETVAGVMASSFDNHRN